MSHVGLEEENFQFSQDEMRTISAHFAAREVAKLFFFVCVCFFPSSPFQLRIIYPSVAYFSGARSRQVVLAT